MSQPPADPASVAFGDFQYEAGSRLLTRDGREVPLPPRSLTLLEALLSSGGRVVERGELLETVWSDACVEDDALSQAMSVLRQALGDDPRAPAYVRTIHGRGYRFLCPLREVGKEPAARVERNTAMSASPSASAPSVLPARAAAPWDHRIAARIRRRPRAAVVAAAVFGAIFGAALTAAWLRHGPAEIVRIEMPAPASVSLAEMSPRSLAISPDGRRLAVVAYGADDSRLYLAARDRFGFAPVAGTESAHGPFFSPAGDRLAYVDFRERQIEVIDLAGGPPRALCSPCDASSGVWGTDGYVYFVGRSAGLFRVAAAGGTPEEVRPLKAGNGEQAISAPSRAPQGHELVFSVLQEGMASWSEALIVRFDPASGEEVAMAARGMEPRLLPGNRLLLARDGRLLLGSATPADTAGSTPAPPPSVVLDDLVTAGLTGAAQYDVTDDGTLVYLPGAERTVTTRVLLVDHQGARRQLELPESLYVGARAARDGRRLALWVAGTSGHVWSFDRARKVATRQTFAGSNMSPVWTPDGRRIAYTRARADGFELLLKEADAATAPQRLLDSPFRLVAGAFSPDGRHLAYTRWREDGTTDIEWLATDTAQSTPLEAGPFTERDGVVSPDGAWLAFVSNETGANEIYLRALAHGGSRLRVSTTGGGTPAFSLEGDELYYIDGDSRLVSVPLQLGGARIGDRPVVGDARVLAEGSFLPSLDVTADGLLVVEEQDGAPPADAVRQVTGWLQDAG